MRRLTCDDCRLDRDEWTPPRASWLVRFLIAVVCLVMSPTAMLADERTDLETAKSIAARLKNGTVAGKMQAYNIGVQCKDGVVSLRGNVANEAQRKLALSIAKETDGVSAVRDELQVVVEPANGAAAKGEAVKSADQSKASPPSPLGSDAEKLLAEIRKQVGAVVDDKHLAADKAFQDRLRKIAGEELKSQVAQPAPRPIDGKVIGSAAPPAPPAAEPPADPKQAAQRVETLWSLSDELDAFANRFERQQMFEQADCLREQSDRLRKEVREMLVARRDVREVVRRRALERAEAPRVYYPGLPAPSYSPLQPPSTPDPLSRAAIAPPHTDTLPTVPVPVPDLPDAGPKSKPREATVQAQKPVIPPTSSPVNTTPSRTADSSAKGFASRGDKASTGNNQVSAQARADEDERRQEARSRLFRGTGRLAELLFKQH